MLFHVFNSQEERRAYGGSAFIEIQFCKLSTKRKVTERVALAVFSIGKMIRCM